MAAATHVETVEGMSLAIKFHSPKSATFEKTHPKHGLRAEMSTDQQGCFARHAILYPGPFPGRNIIGLAEPQQHQSNSHKESPLLLDTPKRSTTGFQIRGLRSAVGSQSHVVSIWIVREHATKMSRWTRSFWTALAGSQQSWRPQWRQTKTMKKESCDMDQDPH